MEDMPHVPIAARASAISVQVAGSGTAAVVNDDAPENAPKLLFPLPVTCRSER